MYRLKALSWLLLGWMLTLPLHAAPLAINEQILNGLTLQGSIEITNSVMRGPVVIAGDLTSENSQFSRALTVSGGCNLSHVKLLAPATIAQHLKGDNLTTYARLTVAGPVDLKTSAIHGTLHTGNPSVTLSNTKLDKLVVELGEGNITHVGNNNSRSSIHVSNHSSSYVNGYQVSSSDTTTTVVTPGGYVFQNGQQLEDKTYKTYSAYQASVTNAPDIVGPGWRHSAAQTLKRSLTDTRLSEAIVRLENGSQVSKTIEFLNTKGVVYISKDSDFTGKIINGRAVELK